VFDFLIYIHELLAPSIGVFLAKKNLFSLALMGVKTQNLLLWSVEQKSVEDSISALIRASDLYTLS